ncbi:MAG: matrixin family metalloprotease [Pseudomonadota bacterium]
MSVNEVSLKQPSSLTSDLIGDFAGDGNGEGLSADPSSWFDRQSLSEKVAATSVLQFGKDHSVANPSAVGLEGAYDFAALVPDLTAADRTGSENDNSSSPISSTSMSDGGLGSLNIGAEEGDLFDLLSATDYADVTSFTLAGHDKGGQASDQDLDVGFVARDSQVGLADQVQLTPLDRLDATSQGSPVEPVIGEIRAVPDQVSFSLEQGALQTTGEEGAASLSDQQPAASMEHGGYCGCCGCGLSQPQAEILAALSNNGDTPESAEFVAQGNKWGDGGMGTTGGVVTWSFMPGSIAIDFNTSTSVDMDQIMPNGYEATIASAFDAWASVADIKFLAVLDDGGAEENPQAADIRVTGENQGTGGILAEAYFPKFGDIHYNSNVNWGNTQLYRTSLHEIGHSIGLRHETNVPSIMAPIDNPSINELQADDIAGARAIYGADPNGGSQLASLDYDLPNDQVNLEINRDVQAASGTNNVNLTGNGLNNLLGGSNGKNTISGGGGRDDISGYGGNDRLLGGGSGDDLDGGSGNDILEGGSGADNLLGGSGNDDLYGGSGNDQLRGGGENDDLRGDEGNDLLRGQSQNDELRGGEGNDDLFGGSGRDELRGNDGDDELFGEKGKDRLYGGSGNDDLDGGDSDDSLWGGSGSDTLVGGAGNDEMRGGGSGDDIDGNEGNDLLIGGSGADQLVGGTQGDTLRGGGGADRLLGGKGDDRLNGGTGNDTLTGNGGADTFVFDNNTGSDTITDFVSLKDVLDVRDYNFNSGADVLAATSNSGGNAVIRLDSNNDVTLEGVTKNQLDANDFIV